MKHTKVIIVATVSTLLLLVLLFWLDYSNNWRINPHSSRIRFPIEELGLVMGLTTAISTVYFASKSLQLQKQLSKPSIGVMVESRNGGCTITNHGDVEVTLEKITQGKYELSFEELKGTQLVNPMIKIDSKSTRLEQPRSDRLAPKQSIGLMSSLTHVGEVESVDAWVVDINIHFHAGSSEQTTISSNRFGFFNNPTLAADHYWNYLHDRAIQEASFQTDVSMTKDKKTLESRVDSYVREKIDIEKVLGSTEPTVQHWLKRMNHLRSHADNPELPQLQGQWIKLFSILTT